MKGNVIAVRWSKKELAEIKLVCDQDEATMTDMIRRAVFEYLLRRADNDAKRA